MLSGEKVEIRMSIGKQVVKTAPEFHRRTKILLGIEWKTIYTLDGGKSGCILPVSYRQNEAKFKRNSLSHLAEENLGLNGTKAVEWLPFISLKVQNEDWKICSLTRKGTWELEAADKASEEKTAVIVKDISVIKGETLDPVLRPQERCFHPTHWRLWLVQTQIHLKKESLNWECRWRAILFPKQLGQGSVCPGSATKVHRGHHSGGRKVPGYTLSWRQNLPGSSTWCWFAGVQNAKVRGPWRLAPGFDNATGDRQCRQGQIPCREALGDHCGKQNVKPKLERRPHNVRDAWSVNRPPRKATGTEGSWLEREATWAIGSKAARWVPQRSPDSKWFYCEFRMLAMEMQMWCFPCGVWACSGRAFLRPPSFPLFWNNSVYSVPLQAREYVSLNRFMFKRLPWVWDGTLNFWTVLKLWRLWGLLKMEFNAFCSMRWLCTLWRT